jgi:hypothetical protein
MHGVAVLRRLGAPITPNDAEAGTAQARLRCFTRPALVRLHAQATGAAATPQHVESEALAWAATFRRFRGDLLLLERPSA